MTDQLPADIAEAIEAFRLKERHEVRLNKLRDPLTWSSADLKRKAARAALDAVILKHLRATDQTNTGE